MYWDWGEQNMGKWKALLLTLAALIGVGTMGTASVQAEVQEINQSKRVLFISSYSYGWDTVQTQIEGIQAGVDEGTTIDYEFMDTKRFATEESLNMFHDMLKYHLENTDPYGVVIVGDDAALMFAMEFREELFRDIPIVFEGVNDEEYAGHRNFGKTVRGQKYPDGIKCEPRCNEGSCHIG